ncbi:thiopeptide-type bacteriocin biosynthesis protein [Streptomyces sp. NPDC000927]|uniref:thiopeptide-type bacteriocin biosynthesis protein n=1 Tax=Streptomyces sp. NPDC000927 TaxID=3154371 RepID=UPI00331D3189
MDVRVIGGPVLRVAAWPVDLLESFAADALARRADQLLALREAITARSGELTDALFPVVPALPRRERRAVLALRRALHAGPEPVRCDASVATLLDAHGDVGRRIRDDLEQRRRLAALTEEFAAAWAAEDGRQRALLRRIARSDRFRTALAVGNPAVHDALERSRRDDGAPARRRRLEHTLWRLLSRACARPTPQGLWSGVVHPHRTETPEKVRYEVGVRLAPFRAAAETLAHRDPLRGRLRRDPSVHREGDAWWWLSFGPDGPVWSRVGGQPLMDAVLTACDGGRSVDPGHLLAALAGDDTAARPALERVLRVLVARGLLQPCAGLPGTAEDVWQALEAVTPGLGAGDAEMWALSVKRIRALCEELALGLAEWSPRRVREQVRACDREAARLFAFADVPAPEGTVVTVDWEPGAAFRLSWTAADDRAAEETIAEALANAGADATTERYRHASVGELAEALAGLPPVPLGEAMRRWDAVQASRHHPGGRPATADSPDTRPGVLDLRFGPRPFTALGVQEDCDLWEERLFADRRSPVHTLAAMTRPTGGGQGAAVLTADGRGHLAFLWGRPQPAVFHARHRPGAADRAAFRAALLGRAVEVVGRDCAEPGTAVRPDLTGARLDLTAAGQASADRWLLTVDDDGRVWCVDSREPARRLMPVYNAAAETGHRDPLSHLLWTAAMSHGWEWLSLGLPALPAEREVWRHHPEVRTHGGIRIGTRRWTVPPVAVAGLVRLSGPARYLAWRQAVRDMGLPALVQVRPEHPAATPLAVPPSSPLALDALVPLVSRADPGPLVITPVSGRKDPRRRLVDGEGREHLWEAAVAWSTSDAPAGHCPGADKRPVLDPYIALCGPESLRATGESWVQCDCDLPADRAEWSRLREGVARWQDEGLVSRWWFLHKPPGIRLRLESPDPGSLRRAMADATPPARLPGLRTTGVYEPETYRFGGPAGLDLAHTHCAADSRLALSWNTCPDGGETSFVPLLGLVTAQTLLSRIAEDADELRDLWLRLDHALRTALGPHVAPDGPPYVDPAVAGSLLAGRVPVTGDAVADTHLVRARRWAARTGDAAALLRRAQGFPVRAWATALVLFHWNRWALTPERLLPVVRAGLSPYDDSACRQEYGSQVRGSGTA